jgi:hypothetical protein
MRDHSFRLRPLAHKLLSRLGCLGGLLLLLTASCGGYPDGLVVVRVEGLLPTISELSVTMKLDNVDATDSKNKPSMTFVVVDDLTRFGVQVPAGTQNVAVTVVGQDVYLQNVRSGSTMFSLSQGRDFTVTLAP